MTTVTASAYAKINLSLDVLSRRPNGYHDVKMVMQSLELHDTLTLSRTAESGIFLEALHAELHPDITWDEHNLIYKAARLFFEAYPQKGGVRIVVDKQIPSAAGLAGGSSDAAATLRGLSMLYDLSVPLNDLQAIGVKIGADVPYCLLLGTALSEGIGEVLTKLPDAPMFYVTIVKPSVDVSTKYVYEHLNLSEHTHHPNISACLDAIQNADPKALCSSLDNILEPVALALCPEVTTLEKKMKELGAAGAIMTGSGPTVFGLFVSKETSEKAADFFLANGYKDTTFATKFFSPND